MVASRRVPRGRARHELIAAALRLIGEQGTRGVTMREVAESAEVSLGSTTYHFDDKTGLITAAMAEHVADTESRVEEGLFNSTMRRSVHADGGVVAPLVSIFADRSRVLVRAELHIAAARDSTHHELHLRSHTALQRLLGTARRAAQLSDDAVATDTALAALHLAALDTAAQHRDAGDFAAAMKTHLSHMFPGPVR